MVRTYMLAEAEKKIIKLEKEVKELEQHLADARKMEEYYRTVAIPEQLGEISDLKTKLIECHNKNTELKGDISSGKG